MKEQKTLVIGSGASGLVAALTLARAGREVLLLEAKPQLGGSLGTQEHGGFRFDIGLQMLGECGKGQNLGRILEELGLDSSALFAELAPTAGIRTGVASTSSPPHGSSHGDQVCPSWVPGAQPSPTAGAHTEQGG